MKSKNQIESAERALREFDGITSHWSRESALSLRVLIYIASLLEAPARQKKRTPSKWQRHVAKYLRAGKTIQAAAVDWKRN